MVVSCVIAEHLKSTSVRASHATEVEAQTLIRRTGICPCCNICRLVDIAAYLRILIDSRGGSGIVRARRIQLAKDDGICLRWRRLVCDTTSEVSWRLWASKSNLPKGIEFVVIVEDSAVDEIRGIRVVPFTVLWDEYIVFGVIVQGIKVFAEVDVIV